MVAHFSQPECNDGSWSYILETRGWVHAGHVTVFDAAGSVDPKNWRSERHEWRQWESHSLGWWDQFRLNLPVSYSADYEPNVTSGVPCDANDGETLTWAYEVFDVNQTDARVDCVVVGSHPDLRLRYAPELSGCEVWEAWTAK